MNRTWAAVSATRIGSTHVRDGRPAQDAHLSWTDARHAVIAVADGHGHQLHFRSGRGAELATRLASDLLRSAAPGFSDADQVAAQLRDEIGPALVAAWVEAVVADVAAHPFTSAERDLVAGDTVIDLVRPYGSTVLAMAASQSVLAILQLGDGESVVVTPDGQASRPLPVDSRLDGTVTTSLCQPEPLKSLRTAALDLEKTGVALAFICTDGFGSGRVEGEDWWRSVGRELVSHAGEHGFEWISEKLPAWLEEPAVVGGDDVTLAIVGLGRDT